MSNEVNHLLKTSWIWKFMVKDQLSYGMNDFIQAYTPLTAMTKDYRELIVAMNELPPFSQMMNANLTLFKQGIDNKWEDSNNDGARNIEFSFERGLLSDDMLNWVILIFVNITLLNKDQVVNGLYIKVKPNVYVIQFWAKFQNKQLQEPFEQNINAIYDKIATHFTTASYPVAPQKSGVDVIEITPEAVSIQRKGLKITDLNQYKSSTRKQSSNRGEFSRNSSSNSSFRQDKSVIKNDRNFSSLTNKNDRK